MFKTPANQKAAKRKGDSQLYRMIKPSNSAPRQHVAVTVEEIFSLRPTPPRNGKRFGGFPFRPRSSLFASSRGVLMSAAPLFRPQKRSYIIVADYADLSSENVKKAGACAPASVCQNSRGRICGMQ